MQTIPVIQFGHSEYILRMEFSPDGSRLATMDTAGLLKLWDVRAGRLLRTLIENGKTSATAEEYFNFSVDGSALLLVAPGGGTAFYDASNGRKLLHVEGMELLSATVTEGGILAPRAETGGVSLIEAATGEAVQNLAWPGRAHRHFGRVAISSDGILVAAASSESCLVVWNRETGDVRQWKVQTTHHSVEPVFSKDGNRLAFHSFHDPIQVIDLESGEYSPLFGGPGIAERFWMDSSGRRLAAYLGTHVTVWNVDRNQVLNETSRDLSPEEAAVWLGDDEGFLFSWSDGNEVYLDDGATGERMWTAAPPPACPFGYRLCFHQTGRYLARNFAEMTEEESALYQHVTVWDMNELSTVSTLPVEGEVCLAIVSRPEQNGFMMATEKGITHRRWNDGQVVNEIELDLSRVMGLAEFPDGSQLLLTDATRTPIAVSLDSERPPVEFRQSFLSAMMISLSRMRWVDPLEDILRLSPFEVAATLDQHLLVVCEAQNVIATSERHAGICLWSLSSGVCVNRYPIQGRSCTALSCSPDGQYLGAALGEDIELLRLPGLVPAGTLQGHKNSVLGLAFSDDGDRIVSAGADSTVRIWNLSNGECEYVLRGHTGPVGAAQFDPSGRFVASAARDATLKIWDAQEGKLLRTILDIAPGSYLVMDSEGRCRAVGDAGVYLSYTVIDGETCRNISVEQYVEEFGDKMQLAEDGMPA